MGRKRVGGKHREKVPPVVAYGPPSKSINGVVAFQHVVRLRGSAQPRRPDSAVL